MKHSNPGDCSLVVATYNWPEALHACMNSIKTQSVLPKEIIVADDGSSDSTAQLVEELKITFPVKVLHIWQPDEGFQLSKIRNKAFAAAKYPYIIQIDGDLVLHPHFIKDHMNLAKPNHFVTGSRVLVDVATTKKILENANAVKPNIFSGTNSNFLNGIRIGLVRRFLARSYKVSGKNKYYVKGCNMAFWKKDLVKVNGYNEAFTGWGREDSELAIRLMNAGVKKQFIKSGGICYHLHHQEASRDLESRNIEMMEHTIANKLTRAEKGLNQYLPN